MELQRIRQGGIWLFAVGATAFGWACHDSSERAAPIADTQQAACRTPTVAPPFRVVDALPGARFDRPLSIARVGSDYLVAGQGGTVARVTRGEDGWTTEPFLDVSSELAESDGESGLIGFAASPDYETRPEVFIAYTGRSTVEGSVFRTVLARLSSTDGGRTIDPSTEEHLFTLERDMKGHNGGRLVFGPDRYLYVGIGDGSWGDPLHRAQDPNELFGKLLRLDVLGDARPYASPPDNPFYSGGGRPEVWAYGLRNPWSFSFAPDGRLWLGDVGHEYWEEIDIITKGGNYGWPLREGSRCFMSSTCDAPGLIDPVFEYGHVDGYSVTGGVVYRGKQAALAGAYVFADFMTGRIWALDAAEPAEARMLVDSGRNISAFGEDEDGEVLLVDYGGQIVRLEASVAETATPATLASLGCLDPARDGEVQPAFTPFDVIAPLWSDGLDKRRWISVPAGAKVHVTDDGRLDVPFGSILLKEFSAQGRRIETRMLTRDAESGGWLGYTFQWNEEQTDAVLIDDAVTVDVDGSPWTLPSRGQCFTCHRTMLGTVLGFVPEQLERDGQLDAFARSGLLDRPVDHGSITPLADPYDTSLPTEPRARSYLAANCASCHGGAGSPMGVIDFRASIGAAEMFTLCRPARIALDDESLEQSASLLIAPGNPRGSAVVQRMSRTGNGRMPPIGRSRVDLAAVDVVSSWIASLSECP